MIKAKSQFKRRSTANNVDIIIPVPSDVDSGKFKATAGSVKYVPEKNAMVWTIKQFPVCFFLSSSIFIILLFQGGKEYLMRAHFKLPSIDSEISDAKPPIEVKFEIPYFTTSGIQVKQFIPH